MRVRTGENPSQITFDHPDGARPTPRADSSEPLGRTSRPSPPDPAAPEAPGAPAAPAVPEVPAGVPGLTALPDDHADELAQIAQMPLEERAAALAAIHEDLASVLHKAEG